MATKGYQRTWFPETRQSLVGVLHIGAGIVCFSLGRGGGGGRQGMWHMPLVPRPPSPSLHYHYMERCGLANFVLIYFTISPLPHDSSNPFATSQSRPDLHSRNVNTMMQYMQSEGLACETSWMRRC